MGDVNHRVAKALVNDNPKHTLFVLEDLSGFRSATEKAQKKDLTITCKSCGYPSNDDRTAATNLYRKGIEYLSQDTVTGK